MSPRCACCGAASAQLAACCGYRDMLRRCYNIAIVSPENSKICTSCVVRLRDACSFKQLVLSTQRNLAESENIYGDASIQAALDEITLALVKEEHVETSDHHEDSDSLASLVDNNTPKVEFDFPVATSRARENKHLEDKSSARGASVRRIKKVHKDQHSTRKSVKMLKAPPERADAIDAALEINAQLTEVFTHTENTTTLLISCNALPFRGLHSRGVRCFYCTASFKTPDLLRRHTTQHHDKHNELKKQPTFTTGEYVLYLDITSLACELCRQNVADLNTLRTHLVNVHGKKFYMQFGDRMIPFVLRNEAPHDCQRCSQKFDTFLSLERHMNTHYRNFACGTCGSGHITSKRLKTHISFSHTSGNFPCESCEKVFTSAVKVKKHFESVHMQKNRFKCPHCPQKFFKYFQRQTHLVKEHDASPTEHKCTLCNKTFQLKDSLAKHTRKEHLLERNHACAECSFTCFTSTGLRNHMVSHTGERTYKCEVCKKSYARKNTLRQHMRIHNNDKRFVCQVCGQGFVQNCSRKSHVKTHHPEILQFGQYPC